MNTLNIQIHCFIISLVVHATFAARKPDRSVLSIKSETCEINPKFGQNAVCVFKPIRNKLGTIHLGGILNVTLNTMFMSVHQFIKNSANIYKRGPVQFTEDLCKLTASADGLLFKFLPILKEYGEKLNIIHPCPYYPQIFDLGIIEVPNLDHNLFTAAYPTGDYKVIFRISDAKNDTIYQNTVTAFFRGSSLFSKF